MDLLYLSLPCLFAKQGRTTSSLPCWLVKESGLPPPKLSQLQTFAPRPRAARIPPTAPPSPTRDFPTETREKNLLSSHKAVEDARLGTTNRTCNFMATARRRDSGTGRNGGDGDTENVWPVGSILAPSFTYSPEPLNHQPNPLPPFLPEPSSSFLMVMVVCLFVF